MTDKGGIDIKQACTYAYLHQRITISVWKVKWRFSENIPPRRNMIKGENGKDEKWEGGKAGIIFLRAKSVLFEMFTCII